MQLKHQILIILINNFRRGCYFVADGVEHGEDERILKYFNIYTKGNCKQECLINRTLEICGCVQFFMIRK
jgi:amiloride-sensitive sodium channel